jgi:hypothetical protein
MEPAVAPACYRTGLGGSLTRNSFISGRDGLRAVPFFPCYGAGNDQSDGTETVPPMKTEHRQRLRAARGKAGAGNRDADVQGYHAAGTVASEMRPYQSDPASCSSSETRCCLLQILEISQALWLVKFPG